MSPLAKYCGCAEGAELLVRRGKGSHGLLISVAFSVCLVWGLRGKPVQGNAPFDGTDFHGTIAYSCDGNFHDPDDWAASSVALAILASAGLQDKLAHFHYNSILSANDAEWEVEHEKSVLGAVELFGFDRKRFFNCQKEYTEAVAHLTQVINAAGPHSPLYLIVAGPVDVPLAALRAANSENRSFVYCISHSRWNDGFGSDFKFSATKRDIIELGVRWVQIQDQNARLSTSPYRRVAASSNKLRSPWAAAAPEEFEPYFWMRGSGSRGLQFLWERMVASTRPDPSDAGMMYFLVTGDSEATPEKLERLLALRQIPKPVLERDVVRLEAENFREMTNYHVEVSSDRTTSHRLCVRPQQRARRGSITTVFDEPYTAERAIYDVAVAYASESDVPGVLRLITGSVQSPSHEISAKTSGWQIHVFPAVSIRRGETLELSAEGNLPRIDYVELRRRNEAIGKPVEVAWEVAKGNRADRSAEKAQQSQRFAPVPGMPLDDPAALPGQVIVAGGRPGYLKVNGGRPLFLCGPDNPEDFLFLGRLLPDGTRDGPQMEIIDFLGKSGVNAVHFLMFRMRRCNIKDEGDDTHCPFIDHDPSKPLNEKVLAQWEYWLTELEKRGIVVHLEFYNDATDVELMGWTLDGEGNLHPHERRFVEGIVTRFKHLKNIIWGLEESSNKLPRTRVAHFRKMAELIRQVDDYRHPIVQSFVTPETAEKDMHPDGVTSADYRENPIIDIATWLHIPPHGKDFDAQHRAYLDYAWRDRDLFIVMRNETEYHSIDRHTARIHNWACALAGMHALEAQLNPARMDRRDRVLDAGKVVAFMEQTDWFRMKPADELASQDTKWVLANRGSSYILYSYDCKKTMGLKELPRGRYELLWFETVDGKWRKDRFEQRETGPAAWAKPADFGAEVAVYLRLASDTR